MNTSLCSLHYRVGDQLKTTKMKKKTFFDNVNFSDAKVFNWPHSAVGTFILSKLRIL